MLTSCITRLIFVLIRKLLPLSLMLVMMNLTACNEKTTQQIKTMPADPTLCAFTRGDCIKRIGDLELSISLTPAHAPSEKPLTLKLLSSDAIDNLQIRLEGRDMFMGVIPVNLREVNKTTYEGKMIYGACSSGYMVWRGFISFNRNGVQQAIVFDFLADNPS
ncbi:hypothetical protein N7V09_12845 [Shewanella seohaensis]|uniref:hypothetical protein n=1 Tax=Shewanella seohaensis TaxID=755175 RepID=UPI00200E0C63|nr:hypothetical protein [Shewanella seohaensis]MCL1121116.1 hypothetical protein [Shewanella seohaensis]UXM80771.1 hypothetical protein N7V09_12845 [Shewanella seohaensis]